MHGALTEKERIFEVFNTIYLHPKSLNGRLKEGKIMLTETYISMVWDDHPFLRVVYNP
jgi:hypothetical protein